MFKCLEQVPGATEGEIKSALEAAGWKIETAVRNLKIQMLGKCPKEKWNFGFPNNSPTCEMLLKASGWDLAEAMRKAQGVRIRGANHTQVNIAFARMHGSSITTDMSRCRGVLQPMCLCPHSTRLIPILYQQGRIDLLL